MRTITDNLTVRPGNEHWEILCPPGDLARLFTQLARTGQNSASEEPVDEQAMAVIPITSALDQAIEKLVDTLIALRYETGNVQLELFSLEEI